MATRLLFLDNNPLCVLAGPEFSGPLGDSPVGFTAAVPLSKAEAIRAAKGTRLRIEHDGTSYECALNRVLTVRARGEDFGTAAIWGTVSPLQEEA